MSAEIEKKTVEEGIQPEPVVMVEKTGMGKYQVTLPDSALNAKRLAIAELVGTLVNEDPVIQTWLREASKPDPDAA